MSRPQPQLGARVLPRHLHESLPSCEARPLGGRRTAAGEPPNGLWYLLSRTISEENLEAEKIAHPRLESDSKSNKVESRE